MNPNSTVRAAVLRALTLAGCGVLAACGGTDALDIYEVCAIDVTLEPTSGAPGTEISVVGTPLTEVRDTRLLVGGVRATVTSVVRESCDTCDICRVYSSCPPCGICLGLGTGLEQAGLDRVQCFGDPLADPPVIGDCAACVETMTFVVPDVTAGPTSVLIMNRNGQSEAVAFEVLPGATDTAEDTASVP